MADNPIIYECSECVVCLDDEASGGSAPQTVFIPCRHRCCCDTCVTKIMDAHLPCPLCRQVIERTRTYLVSDPLIDPTQPVPAEEVAEFKQERRAAYRKQFPAVFRAGAGFIGKGKLARMAAAATLSELELRQRETAGGERMMNGGKAVLVREEDTLLVDYKVGRSKRHESVAYQELEDALNTLKDGLAGDRVDALHVAIHYPQQFWVFRYHGLKSDEALERIDATIKRGGK
jgi:hypothetical protein